MRALILNGARPGDESAAPAARALESAFASHGWEVSEISLRDTFIAYCKGCFDCWVKTPGVCPTRDNAARVTRAMCRSDVLVFLSPVTFGGYSSELKKALDRSIGLVSPQFTRIAGEVHHQRRYAQYPSLLAVGVVADVNAEEERTFSTLVARNAINFHAPTYMAGFVPASASADRVRGLVGDLVGRMTGILKGAA